MTQGAFRASHWWSPIFASVVLFAISACDQATDDHCSLDEHPLAYCADFHVTVSAEEHEWVCFKQSCAETDVPSDGCRLLSHVDNDGISASDECVHEWPNPSEDPDGTSAGDHHGDVGSMGTLGQTDAESSTGTSSSGGSTGSLESAETVSSEDASESSANDTSTSEGTSDSSASEDTSDTSTSEDTSASDDESESDTGSACDDQEVCVPHMEYIDTENPMSCGNCGVSHRSRTCNASGCGFTPWGPYGPCESEGVCTPGVDVLGLPPESCGRCGTGTHQQFRPCENDCTWGEPGPFSECVGESGCEPGSVHPSKTSRGCGECRGLQEGTQTCNDECQWGSTEWGECVECMFEIDDGSGGVREVNWKCNPAFREDVMQPDGSYGKCECNGENPTPQCQDAMVCCEGRPGWNLANQCVHDSAPDSCRSPQFCMTHGECELGWHCDNGTCVLD